MTDRTVANTAESCVLVLVFFVVMTLFERIP